MCTMTTTHAHVFPDPDGPEPLDQRVSRNVAILMALRGENQTTLSLAAGIPKSTLSRRFHGGGWLATEIETLATHYRVEPGLFFRPPDDNVSSGCYSATPKLSVVDGAGGGGGRGVARLRAVHP